MMLIYPYPDLDSESGGNLIRVVDEISGRDKRTLVHHTYVEPRLGALTKPGTHPNSLINAKHFASTGIGWYVFIPVLCWKWKYCDRTSMYVSILNLDKRESASYIRWFCNKYTQYNPCVQAWGKDLNCPFIQVLTPYLSVGPEISLTKTWKTVAWFLNISF